MPIKHSDPLMVLDQTINVQNLLEKAIKRLDDLRDAETRRVTQALEMEANRISQLAQAERERVNEQLALRSVYERQLGEAESKRIDAIRAVDVAAVTVASERATQQASVLANQVVESAETLRTLVATTAASAALQLSQLTSQLTDRLSALERSSYEGIGKGRVADPMIADLLLEMKRMRELQSETSGRGSGVSASWGVGLAVVGAIVGIGGLVLAFVISMRSNS